MKIELLDARFLQDAYPNGKKGRGAWQTYALKSIPVGQCIEIEERYHSSFKVLASRLKKQGWGEFRVVTHEDKVYVWRVK